MAHGASLRVLSRNPRLADQVATNHRTAEISDRQRAMLDLAVKVTRDSAAIGPEDLARLRQHGFSDEDVWDIGAVAAFFNLSNRMANLADMRPNPEFYSMGRDAAPARPAPGPSPA